MDLEKVKNKVKEVIQKATDNYIEEKDRAAYVILAWPSDSNKNGTFMLEKWPGSDDIDLCYSPEFAGFMDLGTPLGSVSMEYFNLDYVANLIKTMYDAYVG